MKRGLQTSYLVDGLVGRRHEHSSGMGVFANQPFKKRALLCVWGGDVVDRAQLAECSPRQQRHALQVEDGLYLVTHREPEVADHINHSCEPNAGMHGQISLVAMRDIVPGEEVCFDYAMTDSSDYDEFDCACGTPSCRGRVSGRDWLRSDLQARYAGWFSSYLARRIAQLTGSSG